MATECRTVHLREATSDDNAFLFALRNDRETVENSIRRRTVGREEHEAWLARALADESIRLFIAEDDGVAIGRGQLARRFDGIYVSVSVAALYRGQGYGRAIIRELVEYAQVWKPGEAVRAEIRRENLTSQLAFMAARFRRIEQRNPCDLWEEAH